MRINRRRDVMEEIERRLYEMERWLEEIERRLDEMLVLLMKSGLIGGRDEEECV